MKFLCPSCKAKYQIADEKIAGRTLKMDCRRCNHQITIRGDAPASDATDDASGASEAPSARQAAPSAARSAAAAPGGLRSAGGGRSASSVGPSPVRAAAVPQPGAPSGARSALGADFRRGAPEPPAPARPAPVEQWHVAINDVPVGPMRRDEIARKIAMGAITGESLSWREGFDDWRPLRDVPELAALLRRATPEPRGGGSSTALPRAPAPAPRSIGGRPSPGAPRPAADMRASARGSVVPIGGRHGAAAAPALEEDEDEVSQDEPTTIASAADLGLAGFGADPLDEKPATKPEPAKGRALGPIPAPRAAPAPVAPKRATPAPSAAMDVGRASSPSGEISFGEPVFAPAPAARAAPEPVVEAFAPLPSAAQAPARERERGGLPVGAWIGIAGVMTFAAVFAFIAAQRLLPPAPVAAVAPAVAPVPEPVAPIAAVIPTSPPAADPTPPTAEPPVAEAAAPPEGEVPAATTTVAGTSPHTGTHHPGATAPATGASGGTAPRTGASSGSVDFERLAEEGSGSSGPTGLSARTGPGSGSGGGSTAAAELTEDQIRTVVNRERTGLTRCWETAIRGMRETPTVRLEVEITIGSSGTVTNAAARGPTVGTLTECIERNVRHWRFPASSATSQTTFPVVFTGTN